MNTKADLKAICAICGVDWEKPCVGLLTGVKYPVKHHVGAKPAKVWVPKHGEEQVVDCD